jgi:activating signal cointegrator 1
MKALTLWQPFATLVAAGVKEVETRSWGTSYRGILAIHAARKWGEDVLEDYDLARESLRKCWGLQFRLPECIAAGNLPPEDTLGCIVAVCHLIDCRLMCEPPNPQDALFGTYGPGRWGWTLAGVKPLLSPVPVRGARLLWDVPPDVAALLPEPFPVPAKPPPWLREARPLDLFEE